MASVEEVLAAERPSSAASAPLARRAESYASPPDWRDEVLYFLLPDRFSDEKSRALLQRRSEDDLWAARPGGREGWRWNAWAESGAHRFQGGTLRGAARRLDYLQRLGVTAIWLGPVWKQRGHQDDYHGYAVQDFLDVDPRFGTRRDLVEFVQAAHERGLRVIFDVIVNHTGENWLYPNDALRPPYNPTGQYDFGKWRGADGRTIDRITSPDDGVWPEELQNPDAYTRAGSGSLDSSEADFRIHNGDDREFRRSDFFNRDLRVGDPDVLSALVNCWCYWIALTDCDGFRIDTLKHITFNQARDFCNAVKEFTQGMGKSNFFLLGEVGGGDFFADKYQDALGENLSAVLDIGEARTSLWRVAKAHSEPDDYFKLFDAQEIERLGSHRILGHHHVSVVDDHDNISVDKIRFSAEVDSPYQVVVAVALQLFTLGIPCLYYGTEQALAGPEPSQRGWVTNWKGSGADTFADRYLRETMFGPEHPRASGREGLPTPAGAFDGQLPGFGPFGTTGHEVFDQGHPVFRRIAHLIEVRQACPELRKGRQYPRPIAEPVAGERGGPLRQAATGDVAAWSRILARREAVCVANPSGRRQDVDIGVGGELCPPGSTLVVVGNTEEVADGGHGQHPVGSTLTVRAGDGQPRVEVRGLAPAEVLVLAKPQER